MTSVSHLYSDLAALKGLSPVGPPLQDEDVLEDLRLASFEEGYRAGWEDAVKARDEETVTLTAEFVQRLQDMSFTYREAQVSLCGALKPLFFQLTSKLLPDLMPAAFQAQVIQQIGELLKAGTDKNIELTVSPEKADLVKHLIAAELNLPFLVRADPTLSAGQVLLRAAASEREINLDAICAEIERAGEAFFRTALEEINDG